MKPKVQIKTKPAAEALKNAVTLPKVQIRVKQPYKTPPPVTGKYA